LTHRPDAGVTIVLPLLRQRECWLAQAVRSALGQTVPCEVIVVISSLTPASNLDVLHASARDFPHRLVIVREARRGFPAAINTGVARATGPRVGLLLSDDWLEPTAVEECARLDADIVSSGHTDFAADGTTLLSHLSRTPLFKIYETLPNLEAKATYLTHFLLIDKSAVLAAGGLDESLGDAPGIDDYDLIWTLLERGASVELTGRPLYNYRVHEGERLTHRDREEQLRVLGRILDKHRVTGEERERSIHQHAPWLGRPEHVVAAELRGGAGDRRSP
jgi:glycosyltransferase involved in cell wall biosynthesis